MPIGLVPRGCVCVQSVSPGSSATSRQFGENAVMVHCAWLGWSWAPNDWVKGRD